MWLAWSVLLSATSTRHHSGQNLLRTHEAQPCESATNFDHCDDAYSLSIRVQTKLNHIRFVFYHSINAKGSPKKMLFLERDQDRDKKKEQALSITFSQSDWFIPKNERL